MATWVYQLALYFFLSLPVCTWWNQAFPHPSVTPCQFVLKWKSNKSLPGVDQTNPGTSWPSWCFSCVALFGGVSWPKKSWSEKTSSKKNPCEVTKGKIVFVAEPFLVYTYFICILHGNLSPQKNMQPNAGIQPPPQQKTVLRSAVMVGHCKPSMQSWVEIIIVGFLGQQVSCRQNTI